MTRGTGSSGPRLWLDPASPRGWFGGRSIIAEEPIDVRAGVSLAEAAAALGAEFAGNGTGLTAVLAGYAGSCTVVKFARWGEPQRGARVPEPEAVCALDDAGWDTSPRAFRSGVNAVRDRIAAGDVYVLNLTARLEGVLRADCPDTAFVTLQSRCAADMGALVVGLPGQTPWIASVSPERFVRVRREGLDASAALSVEIQPIKGTRPRGATPQADADLAAELASDPKERAEHVMVVDMERNDLGVCCIPGSVHVEPLYEVVTTPYCHQLVSTVRGTLRADATVVDVLEACFPCGSVTGAPKRAAMRLIDELEAGARRVYCGALIVAMPGELDSSVLIRTLEGLGDSGRASWGSGAGITHDSDPAAEYLEVLLKASPVTGDTAPETALRETMRVVGASVPLLDRHLARLARGGAGPSVLADVRVAVADQLATPDALVEPARLGVTVTPDGAVSAGLTHEPSSLAVEEGVRFAAIEVEAPPELPRGAAKPASRRYWDRAHRSARLAGADQAVLHTGGGALIDGSTASVWLVRDGRLATPVAPPAVGGVCRELVFDVAAALGVVAEERELTLTDLDAADEVWFSNAYGGFVAARGRGGAVGERVAHEVEATFGGPEDVRAACPTDASP
ncbi:MAG: bifunctional anthranilate synthase component I family protein/class IV aminotransferase [Coriobacteriia bacterium]|nr:bifunctional anthranilate synthase component I family protein/class IV aminotransferase [Coriobacteriia bacterium]